MGNRKNTRKAKAKVASETTATAPTPSRTGPPPLMRPRRRAQAEPVANVDAAEVEAAQVLSSMASSGAQPQSNGAIPAALTPEILAALEKILGNKAVPEVINAGIGSSKVHIPAEADEDDEDDALDEEEEDSTNGNPVSIM